jgi:CRISPR-associated endonuclease/helicase Cas3
MSRDEFIGVFAHSENNKGSWHLLSDHLLSVAKGMSNRFEGTIYKDLAFNIGLLHDAGKSCRKFQNKLKKRNKDSFNHPGMSNLILLENFENYFHPATLDNVVAIIEGHHWGLNNTMREVGYKKDLSEEYKKDEGSYISYIVNFLKQNLIKTDIVIWNDFFIVQELASSLFKNDWLDTSSHFDGSLLTNTNIVVDFKEVLNSHVNGLKSDNSPFSLYRTKFYNYCASHNQRGFIDLSIPTGGGKTYSSMALALSLNHSKVVYIAPYLSILDQTKETLEGVFGSDNVLTHYGLDDISEKVLKSKVDIHNNKLYWDSPFILSSFVQFFESCFSSKVAKLLKVDNIRDCCIIIDEAQNIPIKYRGPIYTLLKYLVEKKDCSVVFCTATPLDYNNSVLSGCTITRIGSEEEVKEFFECSKNVDLKYVQKSSLLDIQDYIDNNIEENNYASVLLVSGMIDSAKSRFDHLRDRFPGYKVLCLTTHVTPKHRKEIFKQIKEYLREKTKFILVSTAIVEAGVDFDFDVGFREVGSLPSIIQCAGRIKRHRKSESGTLFILDSPDIRVINMLSAEVNISRDLIRKDNYSLEEYNKKVDSIKDNDIKLILQDMKNMEFSKVNKKFVLIDSLQVRVLIKDYDDESREVYDSILNSQKKININKMFNNSVNIYKTSLNKFSIEYLEVQDEEFYIYTGKYDSFKGVEKVE